jgi:hypothetical protein
MAFLELGLQVINPEIVSESQEKEEGEKEAAEKKAADIRVQTLAFYQQLADLQGVTATP